MATEFGFSAQMMLFANDKKRGISTFILPIAEVVDRATKRDVQLGIKGDENAGLVKDLADAKAALAANADDATLEKAVADIEKKLNKVNDELRRLNISLNFTIAEMTVADATTKANDIYTGNQALFTTLEDEIEKVKTKKTEGKLSDKGSCDDLKAALDEIKTNVQLNIVEIVKDVKNSKMSIAAPVAVKKAEIISAFELEADGMAAKLIPGDTTIEQLSIDLNTKESAFEIIVKPDDNFILNKQGDIFYLSRGSMILLKTLDDTTP